MDTRALMITDEELVELRSVLERSLEEVRFEARNTDERDFRKQVLHEKDLLQSLCEKTRALASSPPA